MQPYKRSLQNIQLPGLLVRFEVAAGRTSSSRKSSGSGRCGMWSRRCKAKVINSASELEPTVCFARADFY